jgi:hypothetical protein
MTRQMVRQPFVFALVILAIAPALAQEPVKPDADGVQRIRLVAGSYFFKPNHIVVKVNVPVELTASRESGITPHDLVIRADDAGLAVKEDLGPSRKKSLSRPPSPANTRSTAARNCLSSPATVTKAWRACSKSCPSRRISSGSGHTPAPSARA